MASTVHPFSDGPTYSRHSQQYYTLLILLHRPFARYDAPFDVENTDPLREAGQVVGRNYFSTASRKICFEGAIRLSRIVKHHHNSHNGRQIFIAGIDHASTAASVLIAWIANTKEQNDRIEALKHLRWLMDSLRSVRSAYCTAERMIVVLEAVLRENDWESLIEPDSDDRQLLSSPIPARRSANESTINDAKGHSSKKKRLMTSPNLNGASVGPNSLGGSRGCSWKNSSNPINNRLDNVFTSNQRLNIPSRTETPLEAVPEYVFGADLRFSRPRSWIEQPGQMAFYDPLYLNSHDDSLDLTGWSAFDPNSRQNLDNGDPFRDLESVDGAGSFPIQSNAGLAARQYSLDSGPQYGPLRPNDDFT